MTEHRTDGRQCRTAAAVFRPIFTSIAGLAIWLAASACQSTSLMEAADATIAERVLPANVRDQQVPAEMFGMSLVKAWLPGVDWPAVPFGMYRMINATPRWHQLHTGTNHWADDAAAGTGMSRIEAVLLFRDRHGPNMPSMLTLGGGDPDVMGGFPPWLGRVKADTVAEWRRFVRHVGERFDGRIRYWEVWNEPDSRLFYRGSIARLVELTRVASEELRSINAANVIVSPAFTEHGLVGLDDFLAAGGGRYVDVVAWHQDNSAVPERDTVKIKAVQRIMQKHGLAHLPLWTTEGHARIQPGDDAAAIVARTYLVLWAYGVSNFTWYAWDIVDYGIEHPGPWVTLVTADRPHRPTEAGFAYGETVRWLRGARIRSLDIEGELWSIHISLEDGRPAWIVWQTGRREARFEVPWCVTAVRGLDGTTRQWAGSTYSAVTRPVLFF